ncbi:hypothetical protein [uncultured Shimia sp.]|uniref:hypothetical protein n=1 Tax=uncultured Shimia sp. TaxID=573152 RepID=UPI00262B543D|nr:hypothetical protein [uncultured Shimia sp.]
MKPVSLLPRVALIATLAAGPALATDETEGRSMMEHGLLLFLEGLQKQMEPALKDLGDLAEEFGPALDSFANEMGPALADLLEQVEDWSAYEAPEVLPNGDIIIRRKPVEETPDEAEDGATDI